jgi:hypothetical protein
MYFRDSALDVVADRHQHQREDHQQQDQLAGGG